MFGVALWWLLPPSYFLPHMKPVIILPFDVQYDQMASIMPMGEKINHPDAPRGHPGVDYSFEPIADPVPYIASMDGVVRTLSVYDSPEYSGGRGLSKQHADVVIVQGVYQTVYAELDAESLPKHIKKGARLKQGELVGYGNFSRSEMERGKQREMVHWEFGSTSPVLDRFCPLGFFDEMSRARAEAIWKQTNWPEMKAQYPNICNGDYAQAD